MRFTQGGATLGVSSARFPDTGVRTGKEDDMSDGKEDVDAFRRRARRWTHSNMPRSGERSSAVGSSAVRRAQELQQRIFDAGFAGITWPEQYGGQGLTAEHMHAFIDELRGFESPYRMLSVSLGVVGPTILEVGSEAQKAAYIPELLRGDTLWVQLLSEPSGGSDMAGVLTRAVRDGDTWVLNGSKVWTTFGQYADYGLCLTRTNWDVPKHRGLSMFIVAFDAPGVVVKPLTQASGQSEFCEEFFDDVRLSPENLLGADGDGWNVASLLLVHERNALGGGSTYFAGAHADDDTIDGEDQLVELAHRLGLWGDAHIRQVVADCYATTRVAQALASRVATGMRTGAFTGPAGSMLKLFTANLHLQRCALALELAGARTAAWQADDAVVHDIAMQWLTQQGIAIMGGTNEIQRNIISERVLGMPREPAPDKDVPFSQVRTNSTLRSA
jgi:alkylation response protein AidB-like acyl-CoA dehydrogenase